MKEYYKLKDDKKELVEKLNFLMEKTRLDQIIIKDFLTVVQYYAGFCQRRIDGRPKEAWNCDAYFWHDDKFLSMDKFGHVESGNGPKIALDILRQYNLLEGGE